MTAASRFHLAFPVHDLSQARRFYGEILGCEEGRSNDHWVDFNFDGHQIVAHLAPDLCGETATNAVDGKGVPVRHFGLVLGMAEWQALAPANDGEGPKVRRDVGSTVSARPSAQAMIGWGKALLAPGPIGPVASL